MTNTMVAWARSFPAFCAKGGVGKAQAPLTDAMGALTLNATWAAVMPDAHQFKGGLPSVMSEAERPFVYGYIDT